MNKQYDVIVVGAGTAGIPAAISAAERGLKVALVEAQDDIGGTLHLSTASISAAGTSIQQRNGITDDVEGHYADYLRISHGTGRPSLVKRWIEEAADSLEWLLSIGWTATPDEPVFAAEHDLYTVPRTYRSTELGLGVVAALRGALTSAMEHHSIELLNNTRFTGFITKGERVTGIVAESGEQSRELEADAVIVTTGGFTGNSRHWDDFYGFAPLRYSIPTAQGDAIDAVRDIGGDIWFADYLLPNFGAVRDIGGPPSGWIHSSILPTLRPPWEIYVNLEGERFMREDGKHFFAREMALKNQTDWGFWVVYDQGIVDSAPPFLRFPQVTIEEKFSGPDEDYCTAPTLAELAEKMGVRPRALEQTVEFYNCGQAVGSDMLGREHMPAPIGTPPFFAVRHYGYAISCYPGIRVNDDLQATREDGTPIPGLYAAGEAIGIGFLGLGFMSGSIVSSAITFGRRLGRDVLV